MKKIITTNNYAILDVIKKKNKTKSKILLSNSDNKKRKNTGIVKFIKKNKQNIKVGDIVFFDKYSTTKIEILGKKQICIKIKKIICKYNE